MGGRGVFLSGCERHGTSHHQPNGDRGEEKRHVMKMLTPAFRGMLKDVQDRRQLHEKGKREQQEREQSLDRRD
jgi:hypothetical protein